MTPVMWAASCGSPHILQYLCGQTNADLNKKADKDNIYGSPIHMACLCNNFECLEYLLKFGKKGFEPLKMVTLQGNYGGLKPMHVCARQG